MKDNSELRPAFYRRRDTAKVLGVSESKVVQLERQGLLTPLHLAAVGRTVRHQAAEVTALVAKLAQDAKAAD